MNTNEMDSSSALPPPPQDKLTTLDSKKAIKGGGVRSTTPSKKKTTTTTTTTRTKTTKTTTPKSAAVAKKKKKSSTPRTKNKEGAGSSFTPTKKRSPSATKKAAKRTKTTLSSTPKTKAKTTTLAEKAKTTPRSSSSSPSSSPKKKKPPSSPSKKKTRTMTTTPKGKGTPKKKTTPPSKEKKKALTPKNKKTPASKSLPSSSSSSSSPSSSSSLAENQKKKTASTSTPTPKGKEKKKKDEESPKTPIRRKKKATTLAAIASKKKKPNNSTATGKKTARTTTTTPTPKKRMSKKAFGSQGVEKEDHDDDDDDDDDDGGQDDPEDHDHDDDDDDDDDVQVMVVNAEDEEDIEVDEKDVIVVDGDDDDDDDDEEEEKDKDESDETPAAPTPGKKRKKSTASSSLPYASSYSIAAASPNSPEKTKSASAIAADGDGDGDAGGNGNGNNDKRGKTETTEAKNKPPTFLVMVHDVIASLKDRKGSSIPAIVKKLLSDHAQHLNTLNPKIVKLSVSSALKTGIKHERFIKVKASYKINAAWVQKEKAAAKKKDTAEKKRMAVVEKKRKAKAHELEIKKKNEERKKKKEEEKRLKELEMEMIKEEKRLKRKENKAKREAEAAAKAALLAEEQRKKEIEMRIKKRKFPMDDLALIVEDKELGVTPPEDVKERPTLPCVMLGVVPFDERVDKMGANIKPYMVSASNLSKDSSRVGNRGLIADIFGVYHFFRGDVGYCRINEGMTADFTLKHLMYAVQEIVCGNTKKARVVPPLISHLFITALRILTVDESQKEMGSDDEEEEDDESDDENTGAKRKVQPLSLHEQKLKSDLTHLGNIFKGPMAPVSWPEICYNYMDTMHRYFTSAASSKPNIVPGCPVDDDFFGHGDPSSNVPPSSESGNDDVQDGDGVPLPKGYNGYFGKPRSALARGWSKLRRCDPWMLSAEELMSLLRALTDDILANDTELAHDLSERVDGLQELLKAKRAADMNFYKVRKAFEGPKHSSKTKKELTNQGENGTKNGENKDESENTSGSAKAIKGKKIAGMNGAKEAKFKPTATEEEYLEAEKAQLKAHEAYEKGLKKLISRTEPVGLDRFGNGVYFFQHDPESIYVEVLKPSPASFVPKSVYETTQGTDRSWKIIDCKSMFDDFVACLDVRGIRESDLFEAISGRHSSLKRYLYDDKARINALLAREREKSDLERRLENAKIAAEAEESGRRSGRLASLAQSEITKVQAEIKRFEISAEVETAKEPIDYKATTGIEILSEFEEQEYDEEEGTTAYGRCSDLWYFDDEEENGAIGMIVDSMLEIEEQCDELAPWQRKDKSRESWIGGLRDIVRAWREGDSSCIGPPPPEEVVAGVTGDDLKDKRKSRKSKASTPPKPSKYAAKKGKSRNKKEDVALIKIQKGTGELINALKEPLLDLEQRIFCLSGLKMAAEAAEEACDNDSDDSSVDEQEAMENYRKMAQQAWKKEINKLKKTETGRSGAIKNIIVAAMAIARRAHLTDVLTDLRRALLLHGGTAASASKTEALDVLAKRGGYHMDDEDFNFDLNADAPDAAQTGTVEVEAESMLSSDVLAIGGFLAGNDNADRIDWIDSVKSCLTLSKFAVLTQAFVLNSSELLSNIEKKRDALLDCIGFWEGLTKKKKHHNNTDVWAEVEVSSKFCMAKIAGYPWWPARICHPIDRSISSSLKTLNRVLVSFVGEENVHVLKETEIRPYTGEKEDEEQNLQRFKLCDEQTKLAFEQSLDMTKRICRKRGIIDSPRKKKPKAFEDEKKTSV